jgi:hypothetical protein
MNNVFKPLQFEDHGHESLAKTPIGVYEVHCNAENWYIPTTSIKGDDADLLTQTETFEEAKNVCRRHYDEVCKSLLTQKVQNFLISNFN